MDLLGIPKIPRIPRSLGVPGVLELLRHIFLELQDF